MKKILFFGVLALLTSLVICACDGTPAVTDPVDTTVTTDAVTDPVPSEELAAVDDGAVYCIRTEDYFCIGGTTFGTVDGEKAGVRGYRENLDQLWRLVKLEDGTYHIKNASSGLLLSIRMKSDKDGSISVLNTENENHAQRWELVKEGKGVVIRNADTKGYLTILEPDVESSAVQCFEKSEATVWTLKKELDADAVLPEILRLQGDMMAPASCPEIFKYNGVYYNINMTGGIKIKSSTDLITWKNVGTVFNPKPSWISKELGSDSIWAPGFYMVGDQLRVYYCASTSGSRNSVIGMAYANSPLAKFKDGGMVMRSTDSSPYNCIDPNIFTDDDGKIYIIWGSYAEGIYMRRIDEKTGLLDENDTTMWKLADAPNGMEAPYLVKRGDYYYLFVAMGNMSKNENYHWAVGRSESLFGPYVDKKGKPMLEGNTSPLTEYKPGVQAVAHAQPFLDDDGQWYLVSEMWMDRSDPDRKIQLHISKIVWNDEGWPVTALSTNLLDELEGKK